MRMRPNMAVDGDVGGLSCSGPFVGRGRVKML